MNDIPPVSKPTEAQDIRISASPPDEGEQITCVQNNNTYTIGQVIGEGGFGVVYNCSDQWGNNLAVKVLKPIGTYEAVKEKAAQEFERLLVLRHPHVTHVYDAFEFRSTFYIVTEHCTSTLNELLLVDNLKGYLWVKPIARHILYHLGLLFMQIIIGKVLMFTQEDILSGCQQRQHSKNYPTPLTIGVRNFVINGQNFDNIIG